MVEMCPRPISTTREATATEPTLAQSARQLQDGPRLGCAQAGWGRCAEVRSPDVVQGLRGDDLRSFLARGRNLIRRRAPVTKASISATNRCTSDPYANALLIRSSGSCRMFARPRVSQAAPTQ